MRKAALLFLFVSSLVSGFSQDILDDVFQEIEALESELDDLELAEVEESEFAFLIGADINSNLTFHGRTTVSDQLVGLTPFLSMRHESGLFALMVSSITFGSEDDFDGLYSQVGYKGDFNDWSSFSLGLNKYFYSDNSVQINSSTNFGVNAAISMETNNVTATPSIRYDFGHQSDFSASLLLDYFIGRQAGKSTFILINPSIALYGGSQNYYNNFLDDIDERILDSNPNATGYFLTSLQNLTASKIKDLEDGSAFQLLSASASLPLSIALGKVTIGISPEYILPFNEFNLEKTIQTGTDIRADSRWANLSNNQNAWLTSRFINAISLAEQTESTFVFNSSLSYRF